jgi:hypothetical protein
MAKSNTRVIIPLCKTCAKKYKGNKYASIHIVSTKNECLSEYVDLNKVSCLSLKRPSKAKGCKTKHVYQTKENTIIDIGNSKWCWRCGRWIKKVNK